MRRDTIACRVVTAKVPYINFTNFLWVFLGIHQLGFAWSRIILPSSIATEAKRL